MTQSEEEHFPSLLLSVFSAIATLLAAFLHLETAARLRSVDPHLVKPLLNWANICSRT